MKNFRQNLDSLDQILYFCFNNIYSQYKEGFCFNFQKFNEKTEYKLKNYFKKLEKSLEETENLEDIFQELKQKAISLEEKKKEIYKLNVDFFFKMKYIFFYDMLISHYILLLKEINNKEINKVHFDFKKMEEVFINEFKNTMFVYSEIGKQMYPETDYKEKPVTGFLKKNKKKKSLYKNFYYFIFFLLICVVILYACVFSLKSYALLSCFFFFVFKHKKLSEEDFYEKYHKNLQNMSWEEISNLYLTDLYNFFFTDFISPKISFLCLFLSIFLLHYFFKLGIFNSKISPVTYRDTCLRSNLLEYHRIIYSFFYVCTTERTFLKEQIIQTRANKKVNLWNLYYILNVKKKEELKNVIINYKKYIEYNIIENENSFIKLSYAKELKHCNLIFEILEEKKEGEKIPYTIENFEKKMST